MSGELPGRGHYGHPLLRGIYCIFETADSWLGIIGVPPAARDAFFIAMGQPELALDERFLGMMASPDDMKELFTRLSPVFRQKTTDEWCVALREMGVRFAPVRDYHQVVSDPGVRQNGYIATLEDDAGNPVTVVGNPIEMTATPVSPSAVAPELGQHTDEVLREFGYSDADIVNLREQGAI